MGIEGVPQIPADESEKIDDVAKAEVVAYAGKFERDAAAGYRKVESGETPIKKGRTGLGTKAKLASLGNMDIRGGDKKDPSNIDHQEDRVEGFDPDASDEEIRTIASRREKYEDSFASAQERLAEKKYDEANNKE